MAQSTPEEEERALSYDIKRLRQLPAALIEISYVNATPSVLIHHRLGAASYPENFDSVPRVKHVKTKSYSVRDAGRTKIITDIYTPSPLNGYYGLTKMLT